ARDARRLGGGAARPELRNGDAPPLYGGGRPRGRKAGPEAQNRHGGAPRGERPVSWDARRLASAWRAALCARPTGASHAPKRLSALRPPLDSGERRNDANPGRKKRAAGTRWAV